LVPGPFGVSLAARNADEAISRGFSSFEGTSGTLLLSSYFDLIFSTNFLMRGTVNHLYLPLS
ncbi:MAG: hypothetical protein ACLP41_00055, partial [Acidimicrobiales bacterium]